MCQCYENLGTVVYTVPWGMGEEKGAIQASAIPGDVLAK